MADDDKGFEKYLGSLTEEIRSGKLRHELGEIIRHFLFHRNGFEPTEVKRELCRKFVREFNSLVQWVA